jgi:hypothetical protein
MKPLRSVFHAAISEQETFPSSIESLAFAMVAAYGRFVFGYSARRLRSPACPT